MMQRILLLLVFLSTSGAIWAEPVSVQNLRMWQAPDNTRLVFDLSGPLEHQIFTLKNPDRIVVDMDNARLADSLPAVDTSGPILAAIRTGELANNNLRIVLDLKFTIQPRSFVLKPAGDYGHRLVVDLIDSRQVEHEVKAIPSQQDPIPPATDLIVAIDAGHGGEDPGAIGRRYRTREKDVVLAISRELYKLIDKTSGMKPVMIRDGDYYVGLRDRANKARRYNADVFISIHADSLPGHRKQARGASVYALSERGASSVLAKDLANDENASDWIGGVSLDQVDDEVSRVLGDLTKTATISDSLHLGEDILSALKRTSPLHSHTVGQAGFMVLKSPIPSVLVETAFISNPDEERQLRDSGYQKRLARGIFEGLQRAAPRLLARRGLPGGQMLGKASASVREYVVRSGDTLTAIARQHDTNVDALRFFNNIRDNNLPVGFKLRIPAADGG